MDMDVVKLLEPLLLGLGSLLGALLSFAAHKFGKRIESEFAREVLYRASDAVSSSISDVGQNFVKKLKDINGDKKLSPSEAAVALKEASAGAKLLMGPKGVKELAKVLGGASAVDKYLEREIESQLASRKERESILEK